MKKRVIALVLALALGMGFLALASGESVITLSYLNNTLAPELQNAIDARIPSTSGISEYADEAVDKLSREGVLDALTRRVYGKLQLKGDYLYVSANREAISVSKGDVIAGLPGTTVVLEKGSATVANNTIINISTGYEAKAGSAVALNNSYFIPAWDGSGIYITSDSARVLVDGVYRIVPLSYRAQYFDLADALKKMDLFRGTNVGYELSRGATRAEALVMLLRMLGEEDEALKFTGSHPFTDVPEWVDKYVAYAYNMGYTNGISYTKFGSSNATTASHYATFILRALGYDDSKGDFKWDKSLAFAAERGIITNGEKTMIEKSAFMRDHLVYLSYYSLFAHIKGAESTLLDKLCNNGTVNVNIAQNAISCVSRARL